MNVETLRQEVRALMKNHGLTQAELSARTGIPQGNISRFLSGTEMRSSYTLNLLALVQNGPGLTATPTTPPAAGAEAEPAPQEALDA